jgi:hypothetical protein
MAVSEMKARKPEFDMMSPAEREGDCLTCQYARQNIARFEHTPMKVLRVLRVLLGAAVATAEFEWAVGVTWMLAFWGFMSFFGGVSNFSGGEGGKGGAT